MGANDRRILPYAYVADSTRALPGPAQPRGLYRYGFYWWLLDGSTAYTAMGGAGQYIYVNPAHETVIVKASWTLSPPTRPTHAPAEEMPWGRETQSFFKAASEWAAT